jgi:hypothetical protein
MKGKEIDTPAQPGPRLPQLPAGLGLSPDMFTSMMPSGFKPEDAMSSAGMMSLATHALQQTSREMAGKEVGAEEAQAMVGRAVKAGPFIGWVRNAINIVGAFLKPENASIFGEKYAPVLNDFSQVKTFMENIMMNNDDVGAKRMYKHMMYLAMSIPEEFPPIATLGAGLKLMVIEALTLAHVPEMVVPYTCIKVTAGLSTNTSLYHAWYSSLNSTNKDALRMALLKIFTPIIDVCARSHRQYLVTVASLPKGSKAPVAPDFDQISDALGAIMGAMM